MCKCRYRQDKTCVCIICTPHYAFQPNSTMHARSHIPYITNLIRTLPHLAFNQHTYLTNLSFLTKPCPRLVSPIRPFSTRVYIPVSLTIFPSDQKPIRNSIVVSIPACHVGDLGSIPSCGASCTALLFLPFFGEVGGGQWITRDEKKMTIFLLGGREEEWSGKWLWDVGVRLMRKCMLDARCKVLHIMFGIEVMCSSMNSRLLFAPLWCWYTTTSSLMSY